MVGPAAARVPTLTGRRRRGRVPGPRRPLRRAHRGRRAVPRGPPGPGARAARAQRRRQDVDRRDARGLPARRRRARPRTRARPGPPTTAALVARIGVMLQRGGVYPVMAARQVLGLFAAYYDEPEDPDALLDLVGLARCAAHPVAPAVGRRAATAVAGPRPGGPARRASSSTSPPPGVDPEGRLAIRDVVADAARPRRLRGAHHPRARRGRAPGRRGGDHRPGAGRGPGHRRRAVGVGRRGRHPLRRAARRST